VAIKPWAWAADISPLKLGIAVAAIVVRTFRRFKELGIMQRSPINWSARAVDKVGNLSKMIISKHLGGSVRNSGKPLLQHREQTRAVLQMFAKTFRDISGNHISNTTFKGVSFWYTRIWSGRSAVLFLKLLKRQEATREP
jgi:hypothetical protein